jgi:DNA-binding IclR family transcriptional regulator
MQALDRAFSMLEAVALHPVGMGLTEIAVNVGVEKPVAVRYLKSLEKLGYVVRNPENKRYRLGAKVTSLGFASLKGMTVVDVARPVLKALAARAGETADLAVREGAEAVFVWVEGVVQLVTISIGLGIRLPLYLSANGKALLMDMPERQLRALVGDGPYPKAGPNSIRNADALIADIRAAGTRGYAINDEELEAGHRSAAAPVRDATGAIVAAMGLNGPSTRISHADLTESLGPFALDAARQVSQALGART